MKLPAYPKYKPSGVQWLGDVPEHWGVKRLKTSATCWVSNVDKVPADDELPIRLCNYTDVYYHDHITPDMGLMETTATTDEIRRFGLREGDVVITKDSEEWSDIAVPALVKKSAPDLVCGYHLAIIRSRPNLLLGDYLLRAFQACAINQQFQVAASGVTRYGLPKASIGDAWIPLPAPAEQRAIAAFLDQETGRMDRLVAKKRELIERLKEKRTALISRTVTRGLPPAAARAAGLAENPPLKPSGLDWLGDIPKHWEVSKMSRVCTSIRDGTHNPPDRAAGIHRLLSVRNVQDGKFALLSDDRTMTPEDFAELQRSYTVEEGDIVLAIVGATTGISAIVGKLENVTVQRSLAILRPKKSAISSSFLHYVIQSPVVQTEIALTVFKYSAQPGIYLEDIGRLPVVRPPLPEQAVIAAYLDAETAKLDALAAKVEEAIERLQEYRTALITAAVTGKIDVRGSASPGDSTLPTKKGRVNP